MAQLVSYSYGGDGKVSGRVPVPSGEDTVSVSFPVPFRTAGGVPTVQVSLERPTDGDFILLAVESVSLTGFTVKLAGAVPDAGYSILFTAGQ